MPVCQPLAATRTGFTPASDDELANTKINRGLTSRSHAPFCWAHEKSRLAPPEFKMHRVLAGVPDSAKPAEGARRDRCSRASTATPQAKTTEAIP